MQLTATASGRPFVDAPQREQARSRLFDFRIDPDGTPWVLGAGPYCSFGRHSVVPTMAAAAIAVTELFAEAIARALARDVRFRRPDPSFHVDISYVSRPPSYTALRAVTVPEQGGGTVFTDQRRALRTLPDDLLHQIEGRTITHVVTGLELDDDTETAAQHPIVRPHPRTGQPSLFITTPPRCAEVSGLDEAEAAVLVEALFTHATREDNLFRHAWSPGDVVVWDDASVLHAGGTPRSWATGCSTAAWSRPTGTSRTWADRRGHRGRRRVLVEHLLGCAAEHRAERSLSWPLTSPALDHSDPHVCGIIAAHGPMPASTCAWMLDQIAHRGPDGEGALRIGDSWLGHRRLAIVDVEGGDQPIEAAQGGAAMVGNGEIYNHRQLRDHLGDDLAYTTRSDNEVALQLFLAEGVQGLRALRGMFALVVADDEGRFVAIRDPIGIKPLYWARRDGTTLFASELKAFPIDWRDAVVEFPVGHAWTPEDGSTPLFDPPADGATPASPVDTDADEPSEEVLAAIRDTLIEAVDRRLMGDVPVGVFLSGGLDSSLIAAIAARRAEEQGLRVSSFAVGLEGSDDIVAARAIAKHLDTDHHEMIYTAEDLLVALPATIRCIESFDPMLVHSAVPNYLLAEFTGAHVKVVLTGEGADELYAGYTHYRDFEETDALHAELVRSVRGLHNLNLQRCDRTTMAHSLEARVPFLDLDVVDLAFSLPTAWKQPRPDRAEKWLLRTAFDGWLPEAYLWRTKEQFGDGTGASTVLRNAAELECSVRTYEELRGSIDPPLRTREEAVYWRLFHEHLEGVPVGETVGRFSVA